MDGVDSLSSTPFVSAPSSPGRSSGAAAVPCASSSAAHLAYFFSAPASPTHFLLSSSPSISSIATTAASADLEQTDFEFGVPARSMSTAEELFANGQIRPGFVPSVAPIHRRTRSVSPSRNPRKLWREKRKESDALKQTSSESYSGSNSNNTVPKETRMNCSNSVDSASSTSRSSSSSSSNSTCSNSSSVSSRRWGFIKDLLTLQRSKSEGNGCKDDTQSIPGRRSADRSKDDHRTVRLVMEASRRRRRTTFLPYKQHGFLFGCLGFGSRTGFVRNVGVPAVVAASRHS